MSFYPKGNRGTMRGPVNFNPMASSIKLFRAMRGIGTNKQAITEVLAFHTAQQRLELKKKYRYVYKKDLAQVLDGELSFNFAKLVAALMTEPEDYVLECINRVLSPKSTSKKMVRRLSQIFTQGLGKDEYALIDLLCYKSNQYLEDLRNAYREKYFEDLEDELAPDTGHMLPEEFLAIMQDMISGTRDESEEVDEAKIEADVYDIAGEGGEVALQIIFQERSYPHIRRLFVEYRKKTGKLLQTWIEENEKYSLHQKGAYVSIYNKIRNEPQFYAERIRVAIDGMGRDDDALIRIVVLRSEIDLLDIMDAYKDKYAIELATNVAKEASGEYKEMLTKIIRVPEENAPVAVIDPRDFKMDADEIANLDLDEDALKVLLEDENEEGDEEAKEKTEEKGEDD